ncbi:MAG: hypothetical protein A2W93_10990 [Bacteroidetes bacterium GWF2_43_63]|nr:MAG: hypothetical protein A2W94_13860 [Bacteroidetes bacterium GWE2_42_42]OFY54803.1 MAG: hypothetical protein A2W93_10990 [Bacteroidetes bacterium GWF2_43_63]HCB63300.1 hypothetical protein [Bacteroidales bacterium]HCY22042.1 hypothetical protein [Bacteroidales bacterium]
MKKILLLIALTLTFSFVFTACEEDSDDQTTDYAIGSSSWGKLTLTLAETGGPTNEWYFSTTSSSGMAALTGVDDFSYSYSKKGTNESEITFQMGGSDKYVLTWTSASTGTFQESFNGTAGNPGSFTVALD